MENKLTFNDDADNYDRCRPDYPEALFNDIHAYSAIPICNALEIGAGTGQATQGFADKNITVTAIDIGENMVGFLSEKFKNYANCKFIHSSFEDYKANGAFDLVYCATAFHWLEPVSALQKIKGLLNQKATVALFWNHPFVGRENNSMHNEIRKVYAKYRPKDKTPKEFCEEDTHHYENLLKNAGFSDVTVQLYQRERRFSAKEYVCLLNTYSDHRMLAHDIKERFEREIYDRIYTGGNQIIIYDTLDLYLARNT